MQYEFNRQNLEYFLHNNLNLYFKVDAFWPLVDFRRAFEGIPEAAHVFGYMIRNVDRWDTLKALNVYYDMNHKRLSKEEKQVIIEVLIEYVESMQ